MSTGKRLVFLDNLKVLLIALVVFHHAGQAYGPTGGYWDIQDPSRFALLGPFFAVNASFFMALFFFISAYFFPQSYDKKGAGAFIGDKLIRFGIPVLIGLLVIVPAYQYFSFELFRGGQPMGFFDYLINIFFGFGDNPHLANMPNWPELNYGPFWFILHLLVYSLIYALYRFIKGKIMAGKAPREVRQKSPAVWSIILFVVMVTGITAVIRIRYPIDEWVGILGFIQAEPAHLASYAFMFIAGLLARRYGWLTNLKKSVGYVFLGIGAIMGILLFVLYGVNGGYPQELRSAWVLYDTPMGIALCIGFIVLAREKLNTETKLWSYLSGNAFTVYILQQPVLVLLQAALLPVPLNGLFKFLITGTAAFVICNLLATLIRKLRFVRRVLG